MMHDHRLHRTGILVRRIAAFAFPEALKNAQ